MLSLLTTLVTFSTFVWVFLRGPLTKFVIGMNTPNARGIHLKSSIKPKRVEIIHILRQKNLASLLEFLFFPK